MIRLAALALALLAWAPAGWARFDGLVEGPVAVPVAPDGGAAGSLRLSGYLARPDRPGRFPMVLLTHGANDPRVEPWISAKTTARLQAASGSGKPVLFRVDYHAGHGIGSTRDQRQAELADVWSFLLWQFGDPEFQPK